MKQNCPHEPTDFKFSFLEEEEKQFYHGSYAHQLILRIINSLISNYLFSVLS